MNMVINELQKSSIFAQRDSRTFATFLNTKYFLLHHCDHSKTLQWMVNHMLYGLPGRNIPADLGNSCQI